ncbi:helicase [Actinomortierella ambigua]|nr:helicase [Actinomortierella ambigua]
MTCRKGHDSNSQRSTTWKRSFILWPCCGVSIEDFKRGRCFMTPMSSAASTPAPQSALTPKFNKKHTLSVAQQYAEEAPRAFSPQPRHSPDTPGAIVMPRPSSDHPRLRNRTSAKRIPGQSGIVDVVVDPVLGQHLRPHQKEGVRFLYECMMQLKESISGQGVILADEMGLGKTLQTITLLWTLLKQSPFYEEEKAVIKRALIVCPASLILNWKREFKKWLGDERLKVFAVDAKSTLTDFTLGRVYPVMIIGYEKLRMVQEELKNAAFDIVICDEGHRLKTSNIKTALAIRSLPTRRRIILSGTPIQNDLGEFFSMIDFVNPGLFESYSAFKRVFEDPIVRSRQPGCSIAEADLGKERSLEAREGATSDGLYAGLADLLPEIEEELVNPFLGGKLRFVSQFLEVIKSQTTERVVLVSSFTQTLDILQKLCESCGYGFYRLDGLVLFDVDWNPSVDQQAMARIHRDGQERNVFVYRLLSTGTIEEKIFQRQLTKIGLSDALMDDKAEEMNKFTTEQLKDLFTFHEDDSCQTHSLLGCDCIDSLSAGDSLLPQMLSRRSSSALSGRAAEERAQKELREWAHFNVQDWVAFPAQAQGEVVDQDGRTKASAVELASKDRVLWKVIERDLHLQSLILAKDTCGSGESGGSDSEECPKESSWQPRSTMAATSASSLSMHSAALPANYRGIVTFLFVKQLK